MQKLVQANAIPWYKYTMLFFASVERVNFQFSFGRGDEKLQLEYYCIDAVIFVLVRRRHIENTWLTNSQFSNARVISVSNNEWSS